MSVRVIDTETCLFRPGVMAPEMVCLSYAAPGEAPGLIHADDPRTLPFVRWLLEGRDTLVGHHIPYDLGVLAAKWPELVPLIFAKIDRNEITDTKLRQQLLDIAAGHFRGVLRVFEKDVVVDICDVHGENACDEEDDTQTQLQLCRSIGRIRSETRI